MPSRLGTVTLTGRCLFASLWKMPLPKCVMYAHAPGRAMPALVKIRCGCSWSVMASLIAICRNLGVDCGQPRRVHHPRTREESVEIFALKPDNVLIDDRRIHVDFSQSMHGLWRNYKRFGKKGGTAEDGNEAGERGARREGRVNREFVAGDGRRTYEIKGSAMGHIGGGTATYRGEGRGRESRAPPRHDRREDDRGRYEGIRRERSRSRDRDRRRDEDRDRRRRRDGSRDRCRDGDRDGDRDRDRHRKKDRKRERSRSRDRDRKKDRRRDRSRSRSRDASRRDGGDERRREDAPTSGGLDAPRKPGGLEVRKPPRDAPGKDEYDY